MAVESQNFTLGAHFRLVYGNEILEPAVHGMGAPQAGRRDHPEAITLLSWLVVSLTTMSPFVVCHARAS